MRLHNELLRGQSFLLMGTRAEDFWQGYETIFDYFVGVRKHPEKFLRGTKPFRLKNLYELINQSLKEKVTDIWKKWLNRVVWNHLGKLSICVHIFIPYTQRLLDDGVPNHSAERCGVQKHLFIFKMGYENFSNCVKISSALVPRIKNDRSLRMPQTPLFSRPEPFQNLGIEGPSSMNSSYKSRNLHVPKL